MALDERNDSSLLERVRRVWFPNSILRSRFSTTGILLLLVVGTALIAALWKRTLVVPALADELLCHEHVVVALTEQREKNAGRPGSILEPFTNLESINLTINFETEDVESIRSPVHVYYDTFRGRTSDTEGEIVAIRFILGCDVTTSMICE